MSTPTLAEFLAARLDEDEGAARSAGAGAWSAVGGDLYDGTDPHTRNAIGETWEWERDYGEGLAAAAHIARHDPARVLREVEAKRAILALHKPDVDLRDEWYGNDPRCEECGYEGGNINTGPRATQRSWPCRTLRALAAIWSGHPDYRAEWKPA